MALTEKAEGQYQTCVYVTRKNIRMSFLVICQENFEIILMGFPVKRAHFTIICFAKRKNKRQFDSLFGSASSCSPVYSWFLASNPKTSRTSLRDVSASALLC